MTPPLVTRRLELVPLTIAVVESVMRGERDEAERLVRARMPSKWPNRELVERAFPLSLDAIRATPEERLWGDRVLIARNGEGERRVVGSVVFHGPPTNEGVVEIAYGVEEGSQGQGYATEAVSACVVWALGHGTVRAVQAATFAWHVASLRVIEKVGMVRAGVREHELLGELLVFERRKGSSAP